jgi:hypothetical protein
VGRAGKVVLAVGVYDTADILADYLDWHLGIGVDFIVVLDYGSTDGSVDILERFRSAGRLDWRHHRDHNYSRCNPFDAAAAIARDEFAADWIIVCDTDEFLVTDERPLDEFLAEALQQGVTTLSLPCFNMTGRRVAVGERAPQVLTLRIDRPMTVGGRQHLCDDLPVPYIFMRHLPKTIVRADALVGYGPGSHRAETAFGATATPLAARFLHYQARGYAAFQRKVANVARWLDENRELPPIFGWHWRRWVRLEAEGELAAEHLRQFVSDAAAEELLRRGVCSRDDTVAKWLAARPGVISSA